MKSRIILFALLVLFSMKMTADTDETITVAGAQVSKFANHLTFSNGQVTLTYEDGSTQTANLDEVNIAFDYVAHLSDAPDFDNLQTLKTFGKRVVKVDVSRTVKTGQWNTICLPFDMDASAIANCFGSGAKVAEFDSDADGSINFKSVQEMLCGVPYIVQPSKNVEGIVLDDVLLTNLETGNTSLGNDFNFIGTICATTPEGNIYYIADGNKLKTLAAGNPVKAFHAYLEGLNDEASAKTIVIDGDTNGIETPSFANAQAGIKVYNLNGQYVGASSVGLQKGIYIINGRKVIVK